MIYKANSLAFYWSKIVCFPTTFARNVQNIEHQTDVLGNKNSNCIVLKVVLFMNGSCIILNW